VENQLSLALVLFNYIDDKDLFQKFYSRFLAKRLIYKTSISDEMEYMMLSKLKVTCGVEYTSKLQRMFTDISLSQELSSSFKESSTSKTLDPSLLILTAGAWPFTQASAVPQFIENLPSEIAESVASFSSFYTGKHNGRRLFWMWNLCRGWFLLIAPLGFIISNCILQYYVADVKFHGYDKGYEVNMSLHQMAILLLFNDKDSMTVDEICKALGAAKEDVTKSVQSLADARILGFVHDEVASIKRDFTNKRLRFKLAATAGSGETQLAPGESESVQRAIEEDRKLYLQALIVRIMKSKREMNHNELITLIIQNSKHRFSPSVSQIKKTIEQLIEKQYIERAETGHDKYIYVA
jgi:DNA-binding MarR family transcriptional regulator